MAGDWIPIRCNLLNDPAVIAVAAATGLDEYAVAGRLLKLWAWANEHTTDGNARGVTEKWIDRFVSAECFANGLISAGWLLIEDGKVVFPNFDRWNSQSAKARVLTAKRVANYRSQNGNGRNVTTALAKEEKRREEETPLPPELNTPTFRESWKAWQTHRREIKKPLKPTMLSRQLKKLAGMGIDRAVRCVEHTIEKGWIGLREPDGEPQAAQSEKPRPATPFEMAHGRYNGRTGFETDASGKIICDRLCKDLDCEHCKPQRGGGAS